MIEMAADTLKNTQYVLTNHGKLVVSEKQGESFLNFLFIYYN